VSKAKTESFRRTVDAVLQSAVQKLPDIDLAVTAIFDGVALLDSRRNVDVDTLKGAALTIVEFANTFKSASYDPLRHVLINLGLNYQMIVVEKQRILGQEDEAAQQLLFAHGYAVMLAGWDEHFPPSGRILGKLSWNEHKAPALVCSIEEARAELIEYHGRLKEKLDRAQRNCDMARFIMSDSQSLINSCRRQFELRFSDRTVVLRPDVDYRDTLDFAERVLAGGEAYLKRVDVLCTEESVNRSARAVTVASLADAKIKSILAGVYVRYWEKTPGYRDYEVLGEQARAYADACTGNNWTFFVPPAFYRPTEPLLAATQHDVDRQLEYGELALNYAMCLNMQMKVMPRWKHQFKLPEPVTLPVEPPVALEPFRFNDPDNGNDDQAAYRKWHHYITGENLRENSWLRIGHRDGPSPKHRLVGFAYSRGGQKHKHKRSRRQAQSVAA